MSGIREPRYGWVMVALGALMTCIAIGGWIYDSFGRYTWMYLFSASIGLAAAAIAFAFPPFPKVARAPAPVPA